MVPECLASIPANSLPTPSAPGRSLLASERETAQRRLHNYFAAWGIAEGTSRDVLVKSLLDRAERDFLRNSSARSATSISSLALTGAKRALLNWISLSKEEKNLDESESLTVENRVALLLIHEGESWQTYFLSGTPLPSLREACQSAQRLSATPELQPAEMIARTIPLGILCKLPLISLQRAFRRASASWMLWWGVIIVSASTLFVSTFFLMR